MSKQLHIADGDCATDALRAHGFEGDFLNWLDGLHDGPVHAHLPFSQRLEERARFVASCGWDTYDEALRRLALRYQQLGGDHSRIWIWQGPELFDQLQLLEILAWLSENPTVATRCIYVPVSHSVPMCTAEMLKQEQRTRALPVTAPMIALGLKCWRIFGGSDLNRLLSLDLSGTDELPHLAAAWARLCAMAPDHQGLTQTHRHILSALSEGPQTPIALFKACQAKEPVPFMGDSSFWMRLSQLTATGPLVHPSFPSSPKKEELKQRMELTDQGHKVLQGKASWPTPTYHLGGMRCGKGPN